ncbi:GerMN domain-containing protein [Paenibacillus shirakamiensis]|nr:GerMN domain-containing protein [Paenibacillus shirakamiensis]
MSKRMWIVALLVVVVMINAGCGQKPTAQPQGSGTQQENQTPPTTGSTDTGTTGSAPSENPSKKPSEDSKEPEAKTLSIDAYFTDDQMMELKKEQKSIRYTSDKDKYKAAYAALQVSGNEKLFALWGKIHLLSSELKDGKLTLDMHMPDEARLGAGGESFALQALTKTMFQFEEVKSIELLATGNQVDSLMGHVELEHPITRNSSF